MKYLLGCCLVFIFIGLIACSEENLFIDFNYDFNDCDPLIPEESLCSLPFPSNKYLVEDSQTPTGYRVNFSSNALPYSTKKKSIFTPDYNTLDGFSPASQILVYFPDIDISNMPSINSMDVSLTQDSPTLIINAETGEKLPHFAELDESGEGLSSEIKLLIIRPATRLSDNTRYIVVLKDIYDTLGNPIPPSHAFYLLRENQLTKNAALESRRERFYTMFDDLERFGIAKKNLVLAWDFHTASTQCLTGRMLYMIEDAKSRPEVIHGFSFSIDRDDTYTTGENAFYRRRIDGHFNAPLYMTKDSPGATMVLDSNGNPLYQGTASVPFSVGIPHAAVDGHIDTADKPEKTRLLQYGHGLFDLGINAIDYSSVASVANDYNFIIFATDWQGMSRYDATNIISLVADIRRFPEVADRLQQGILNKLLLMDMMQTTFKTYNEGEFVSDIITHSGLSGSDAIDDGGYYYGYSQGGTFGATYLALSDVVDRAVLGVPGSPYALMLQRSVDFTYFDNMMKSVYPFCQTRTMILSYIQMLWDRAEPSGYLNHLSDQSNYLRGSKPKLALILMGIYDHQVPNISTHFMARSANIPYMDFNTTSIWNVNEASAPHNGSGLVDFKDSSVDPNPLTNTRPEGGNDPHYLAQGKTATKQMISHFLKDNGKIKHYCTAACDDDD